MSANSPLVLIGIGTAGTRIARGVSRAFGDGLRYATADTDASSAAVGGETFTLLGGDRLSGLGAGGDIVSARLAAEDSIEKLDDHLGGIRLAVIVTCLGGGTGGGATLEIVKHLSRRGIPSIVFATLPFTFEGEDRLRVARGVMSMIEDAASATFFLPMDKLVGDADGMEDAMRRATDTVASGVTLFWRLVEKPGYIRLDTERIRHIVQCAGRGRFAAVTCQGAKRAEEAVDRLIRSELLATAQAPVQAALCGVLGGNDLLLSELATIADGLQQAFGTHVTFDLGTVNDESTFSGRISVVVLLFETAGKEPGRETGGAAAGRRPRGQKSPLSVGPSGRGRFTSAERTEWHGEDLDVPTFIRQNITLEI